MKDEKKELKEISETLNNALDDLYKKIIGSSPELEDLAKATQMTHTITNYMLEGAIERMISGRDYDTNTLRVMIMTKNVGTILKHLTSYHLIQVTLELEIIDKKEYIVLDELNKLRNRFAHATTTSKPPSKMTGEEIKKNFFMLDQAITIVQKVINREYKSYFELKKIK